MRTSGVEVRKACERAEKPKGPNDDLLAMGVARTVPVWWDGRSRVEGRRLVRAALDSRPILPGSAVMSV
jgi:hypothetical protein